MFFIWVKLTPDRNLTRTSGSAFSVSPAEEGLPTGRTTLFEGVLTDRKPSCQRLTCPKTAASVIKTTAIPKCIQILLRFILLLREILFTQLFGGLMKTRSGRLERQT